MRPAALIAEWRQCGALRQADLDLFKADGIPVLALAFGPGMVGFCIARDRVIVAGRHFEFERYAHGSDGIRSAYVVVALDRWGDPADLIAFRPRRSPFVASWLGRVGLLGEERLDAWRLGDPLAIHADPASWLRAGRDGVCVVDQRFAGPMLREVGPLSVGDQVERRRLVDMMTARLPRVVIRTEERRAA